MLLEVPDDRAKAALLKEALKRRAKDPFYWAKEILGFSEIEENPHREWANWWLEFMASPRQFQGLIIPRGHFKTSFFTISQSLKMVLDDPNQRILLVNAKLENAKTFLSIIKNFLTSNEVIHFLYGNVAAEADKWTETAIRLPRTNVKIKEPTIDTIGVGADVTSQHYDFIFYDDVVNPDNVSTSDQRRKVKDWWKQSLSLLDPPQRDKNKITKGLVIGNRYHFDDLYGWLLEEFPKEIPFLIRSCYLEDGSPYFPNIFSAEVLKDLRKKQGSTMFSHLYLNKPVADEGAPFDPTEIQWWEREEELPFRANRYMAVDAAFSLAESADFCAIVVVDVDVQGKLWVVEARQGKWGVAQAAQEIYFSYQKHSPRKIGYESGTIRYALEYALDNEAQRRGFRLPLEALKGDLRSKDQRIRALGDYTANKSLFLHKNQKELYQQILDYGALAHDDLIDALARILDIAKSPIKKVGSPPKRKILGYGAQYTGY